MINKMILECGTDWSTILDLVQAKGESFNNVNHATVMIRLRKARHMVNKSDPRFVAYLERLADLLESQGLDWIQTRPCSNILHAIATMGLHQRNVNAQRVLQWISTPDTVVSFVHRAKPDEIALVVWAFAKFGVVARILFDEVQHVADKIGNHPATGFFQYCRGLCQTRILSE